MKYKLFWAETEDHDEDWFIIAKTKRSAASRHEGAEGYNTGEAWATKVCDIPDDFQGLASKSVWPSEDIIKACGGKFLDQIHRKTTLHYVLGCGQRIVAFGDDVYVEGDIVSNVFTSLKPKGEQ